MEKRQARFFFYKINSRDSERFEWELGLRFLVIGRLSNQIFKSLLHSFEVEPVLLLPLPTTSENVVDLSRDGSSWRKTISPFELIHEVVVTNSRVGCLSICEDFVASHSKRPNIRLFVEVPALKGTMMGWRRELC